jgi:thiosulfate reductase cytochrome b subunit
MQGSETIYRHALAIRITHWVNALVLFIMLLSGLQIFNAHPALYWGQASNFGAPLLSPGRFPDWATLPGTQWLAMGRRWHFFFAWFFVLNGLAYWGYSLWRRHVQKDLLPGKAELKRIPQVFWDHLRFRFPEGEEARAYNVLQKLAYFGVAFVLGPLVVLTGLTMSPAMDTSFPILLDLFGGRQSARTIHFLCAFGFVAFFAVHIVMVLISGVGNNIRSMITGWYRIPPEQHHG